MEVRCIALLDQRSNFFFQKPDKSAVPRPWAAGARLRVACFFVGLFKTMVDYMNQGICDHVWKWRTLFLHSGSNALEENRRQFCWDVVTAALHELRPGSKNRKTMEIWLNQGPKPNISNQSINDELTKILKEPMEEFFTHSVTLECLAQSKRPFYGTTGRSTPKDEVTPFLFIIDEAAYLYQSNYMHSFMWVLDQPMMSILAEMQTPAASNFFVLMLGTHSQISHFAPHYTFPSERYFTGEQYIPSVFLSLEWDTGLHHSNAESWFDGSSRIEKLVRWGRPLWSAVYDGQRPAAVRALESDKMNKTDLRRCVWYAARKLLPAKQDYSNLEQLNLSAFAVLAVRLHLDLDFVFPSRASKLVSSKMRWLIDVDPRRKHIVTTYGSEPLLVEGAALVMNSHELYRATPDPLVKLLADFKDQLNQGYVNRGENGELTARLLRTNPVIVIALILSSLGKGSSDAGIMVEGPGFPRA